MTASASSTSARERGDPHVPGLVPPHELDQLVETIHAAAEARAGSRRARPRRTSISIRSTARSTTRSRATSATICSRARFSSSRRACRRSITSGLLAGQNDVELLRRSGVGRDINRHYYTRESSRGAAAAGRPQPLRADSLAQHSSRVRRRILERRVERHRARHALAKRRRARGAARRLREPRLPPRR